MRRATVAVLAVAIGCTAAEPSGTFSEIAVDTAAPPGCTPRPTS